MNELTQTASGLSRDDFARFLALCIEQNTYADGPFRTLDRTGIGELIEIAPERGRAANPKITLSVCGDRGGDGRSIESLIRWGRTA